MGRGVTTYILTFIIGIVISKVLNYYIEVPILPILCFSVISFIALLFINNKISNTSYIIIAHVVMLLIGITQYNLSIAKTNNPSTTNNAPPLRDYLSNKLKNIATTPNEHAVLTAITLGNKSELTKDLKKAYSNSGAMHILALSGLHIGVIYGIISLLLFFLNFSYRARVIKLILSGIMIIFYGYITGFSPSVQRASIMIILYNIAFWDNRKPNKYSILAIAAFLITLIDPNQLFSIGFQLSFAAVLGIIIIYPTINKSFEALYPDKSEFGVLSGNKYVKKGAFFVWGMIGISVACQITTLPFTIYYFGSAAPYFLLTNLAAIPLATITLYALVPAIALNSVPYIGEFLSNAITELLRVLNLIVEYIG